MKHEAGLRKKLKVSDFSIISQNCVGGVIYHMLGLPMLSPTVDMFIEDDSFIKLTQDPYKYLHDLEPYAVSERTDGNDGHPYPVIGVGDITLNCMHYQCCDEAIEAWNRRRTRVNYNKIMVIAASWDLHDKEEYINAILALECPHILFSYHKIKDDTCVYLDHAIWKENEKGHLKPNLVEYYKKGYLRSFELATNIVGWINDSFETEE